MSFSDEIKEKIEDKIFTSNIDKNHLADLLKRLSEVSNESGQVKINYTGLILSNFTDNIEKTFDINAASPTIVAPPTTTYPKSTPNNYAGIFDSLQGINPIGRLKENPINGQTHLWRIQGAYSNKANGNNGELQIIFTNPVSGFLYIYGITLPTGRTQGVFNCLFLSIADQASIPFGSGYILKSSTSFTDTNLTVEITSITRNSIPFENLIT